MHPVKKRLTLFGFEISIENPKGSSRHWKDPHSGESGSTLMRWDYGYIRRTKGTDGDHVDVYVGPNSESERVFIVNQMKKPSFKEFDEQKVMLGWDDAASAKAAYIKQYDNPKFFGSMTEMPLSEFQQKVLDRSNFGKKVAQVIFGGAAADPLVNIDYDKLSNGDMMQYFADHPQKLKEYLERKEQKAMSKEKKSELSYYLELNMAKMSAGEAPVLGEKRKERGIGDNIPPQTDFAAAVQGDPIKAASGDRVNHIAERVDDIGIGILAAPYAADLVGHGLEKFKSPALRVAGKTLSKTLGNKSSFGKSHARELVGLGLVAPGVTHSVAKGIDKATAKTATILVKEDMEALAKDISLELERRGFGGSQADDIAAALVKEQKLDKIASKYFPDYEYQTEDEKRASREKLARLTKKADAVSAVARRAAQSAATVVPKQMQRAAAGAQKFLPTAGGHAALPQGSAAIRVHKPKVQASTAPQNFYPAAKGPQGHSPGVQAAPAVQAAPVATGATPANPQAPIPPRRRIGWGAVPLGAGLAVGGLGIGGGIAVQGAANGVSRLATSSGHEPIYSEAFVGPGRLGT